MLDAPSILVANFTTTGDALTVAFDADTDLGGYESGDFFDCAAILDFDGADDAECYWVDARTLRQTKNPRAGAGRSELENRRKRTRRAGFPEVWGRSCF